MYLDSDVKQLLKNYRNDINNKNFKKIYDEAAEFEADANIVGNFTQTLLKAGIDPLALDENLKCIPQNYLYNSMIDKFTVPSKVNFIGENAFLNSDLKEISFEQNSKLDFIRGGAFYACTYLESIKLPPSTTMLGERCFAFCESLEYVYLPKTLHIIGDGCFYGAYNMKEIEYEGTMKDFENILEKYFDATTRGGIPYIKCVDGIYELK